MDDAEKRKDYLLLKISIYTQSYGKDQTVISHLWELLGYFWNFVTCIFLTD